MNGMSYVVKIVYSSVGNDGPLSPSFSVPLLELSLIESTDNSPWVSSWQDGKYRKACSLKAVSLVDLVEAMTRFGNQIPQNLEYGHESTLKHDHKMRLCSAILPIFSGLKELARMVPHFMANQLGLHGRIGKLKMPGPRGHFKVGQKPRPHPHHFSRGSLASSCPPRFSRNTHLEPFFPLLSCGRKFFQGSSGLAWLIFGSHCSRLYRQNAVLARGVPWLHFGAGSWLHGLHAMIAFQDYACLSSRHAAQPGPWWVIILPLRHSFCGDLLVQQKQLVCVCSSQSG